MAAFVIRRAGQGIVVMIGVTIIVFGTLHLLPGGVVFGAAGPAAGELPRRSSWR